MASNGNNENPGEHVQPKANGAAPQDGDVDNADVDNDDQDVDAIHDCLETDEDGRFYTGDHKYRSPRYASRYASRYGKKHGKRYAWYRGPRHDLRGNIAERLRSARLYLDDFGDDFRPRRYRRGRGWRRR